MALVCLIENKQTLLLYKDQIRLRFCVPTIVADFFTNSLLLFTISFIVHLLKTFK